MTYPLGQNADFRCCTMLFVFLSIIPISLFLGIVLQGLQTENSNYMYGFTNKIIIDSMNVTHRITIDFREYDKVEQTIKPNYFSYSMENTEKQFIVTHDYVNQTFSNFILTKETFKFANFTEYKKQKQTLQYNNSVIVNLYDPFNKQANIYFFIN